MAVIIEKPLTESKCAALADYIPLLFNLCAQAVLDLQDEGGPLSNGSATSAFVTSPVPKAASVAGDLPHLDLHINTCSVSEGASTQRLGPLERKSLSRVLSVSQDIDNMGAHRHSNGSSSQRGE